MDPPRLTRLVQPFHVDVNRPGQPPARRPPHRGPTVSDATGQTARPPTRCPSGRAVRETSASRRTDTIAPALTDVCKTESSSLEAEPRAPVPIDIKKAQRIQSLPPYLFAEIDRMKREVAA